ncbi:macrolide 2'-phosphotransferase [Leifsonia xyli subsp. cynodontis DSM 46306]|jgi:aminoglycoside phosphotransferase (APT) family kinase protein|uniref:Aminoglycoside phosphotransferase domain-containing protein n=1 Tax=Leifsonia xyli subsp. cynodontis DSM 46306 TaxID=1389489 RepID=U3P6D6_LEIXC|nr:phosphotransferase [Leifsonia xyli]AGW41024.1 macrolide 2'-phosphotransferase [Leifsonia xyli subsp. cynodontis DSM 46306]
MARSPLTLAALAASAVPDLAVSGARPHSGDGVGEFDSALLTARDGSTLIVRVPISQVAETEQSADLVALRALTAGIRSRLPFDVPRYLGQAPVGGTRAIVYNYLPGHHIDVEDIPPGDGLAGSIGHAIATIHALPTSFVGEAGLPALTSAECLASTAQVIESATATGLVPAALRDRWRDAVADHSVWQFQPSVINGALGVESFLVEDDTVSAVLGWSALRVGDPARDLHWLLALNPDAADGALGAYAATRQVATDRQFTQRAMLYAELEVARWLLHGRGLRDQSIVDDAVQMLDGLVDRVHSNTATPLSRATGPILAVGDVEALLDRTPGDRSGARSDGMRPVAEPDAG